MTDLVTETDLLIDTDPAPATPLIQLQTVTSQPLAVELSTGTGLLQPSKPTRTRLDHFPEDLFDLRDESHLVRLMKVLLGDSGAGQLRKRQLIVRLQSALNSTNFYDLDSFYGSLFGAKRGLTGSLPLNPYEDLATADGWDEVSTIDADFRERIVQLAKAITLGGTPKGLQAAAEALTGGPCEVYEVWALLDSQGGTSATRTWNDVDGSSNGNHPTWDAFGGQTWDDVTGTVVFGQMGNDARNEIVVRPKKTYSNDADGIRLRAQDVYNITRVLDVLKPVNTLLTVDPDGVEIHLPVTPGALTADSNYWDISVRVVPKDELKSFYDVVYQAYDHRANPQGIDSAKPVPAFSSSQGTQYSYVSEVSSVIADYTIGVGNTLNILNDPNNPLSKPAHQNEYDTVKWPDGSKTVYRPEYALIDPKQAAAAKAANDGQLVAAPYSGPREVIATHG